MAKPSSERGPIVARPEKWPQFDRKARLWPNPQSEPVRKAKSVARSVRKARREARPEERPDDE